MLTSNWASCDRLAAGSTGAAHSPPLRPRVCVQLRKAEAVVENDAMWPGRTEKRQRMQVGRRYAPGSRCDLLRPGAASTAPQPSHTQSSLPPLPEQAITYNNLGCLFKRHNMPQVALQVSAGVARMHVHGAVRSPCQACRRRPWQLPNLAPQLALFPASCAPPARLRSTCKRRSRSSGLATTCRTAAAPTSTSAPLSRRCGGQRRCGRRRGGGVCMHAPRPSQRWN